MGSFPLSQTLTYSPTVIFCLIILTSLSLASKSPIKSSKPTAYEMLNQFNFPSGLLPKGIVDYDLDPSTGKWAAYLNTTCSFSLEGSYQLSYKPAIKGYITEGKLTGLEGVSVKVFWIWVNIIEVVREDDALRFSVGIASADFPIENFEESPACGCGLNCGDDDEGNGKKKKKKKKKKNGEIPAVSSY